MFKRLRGIYHGKKIEEKMLIGWQEWCGFPKLKIPAIKAKIDTGAKTSALHAFAIKPYYRNGVLHVKFSVYPFQGRKDKVIVCRAKVVDQRNVMSSNGHREKRYVISTPLTLGEERWDIELTLSNRDPLQFRMLLGREALRHGRLVIDPRLSQCQTRPRKSTSKRHTA